MGFTRILEPHLQMRKGGKEFKSLKPFQDLHENFLEYTPVVSEMFSSNRQKYTYIFYNSIMKI